MKLRYKYFILYCISRLVNDCVLKVLDLGQNKQNLIKI